MTDSRLVTLPYKVPPSTLPVKTELFIQEYVMCGNAGRAYRTVFGEAQSRHPARVAREILQRPDVLARLRVHQDAIAAMSIKSTSSLVRELEEIVEADVGELVRLAVGSCRHCWGIAGFYQWRDMAEFETAMNKAIEMRKPPPEMTGGFEYRFNREPNPDCLQCEGDGIQRVRLMDTDAISPGARRLYKGIECNPDGSIKKVLLHDQLAARTELHRIRGMHIERSVSVNVAGRLPDAKDIAASPDKVNDFLEGLTK